MPEDVWEDFNIERPHLILCEGRADLEFLKRLLEVHGLDDFQVTTPTPQGGGITKFPEFLSILPLNRNFESLTSLTLVSDNDTANNNPFHRLQQQIRKTRQFDATAHYPIPTEPLEPANKTGYPAVIGILLPWHDRRGNLEVLILDAFSERWPELRARAEAYLNDTEAHDWNDDQKAIALVQCMIATLCRQSPNCSLSWIWSRREFQDLLEHPAFSQVVEFFRNFPV